jgi:hypothetical protein
MSAAALAQDPAPDLATAARRAAMALARDAEALVGATDLCILLAALDQRDRPSAQAVCVAYLEDTAAGMPDAVAVLAQGLRADAEFWADTATPAELEAYTAAGLRAIERAAFGLVARRRLLAAIWAGLPADDQRAFLRRVDPRGLFAGVAA